MRQTLTMEDRILVCIQHEFGIMKNDGYAITVNRIPRDGRIVGEVSKTWTNVDVPTMAGIRSDSPIFRLSMQPAIRLHDLIRIPTRKTPRIGKSDW